MARRTRAPVRTRKSIFGPPATTPEAAFIRFGNTLHWEADLGSISGSCHSSLAALVEAALARMKRAEHRLVAEFITELTGGGYTFAAAQVIWKRTHSDLTWSTWDDPAAFLRFLAVRATIDPDRATIPNQPRLDDVRRCAACFLSAQSRGDAARCFASVPPPPGTAPDGPRSP